MDSTKIQCVLLTEYITNDSISFSEQLSALKEVYCRVSKKSQSIIKNESKFVPSIIVHKNIQEFSNIPSVSMMQEIETNYPSDTENIIDGKREMLSNLQVCCPNENQKATNKNNTIKCIESCEEICSIVRCPTNPSNANFTLTNANNQSAADSFIVWSSRNESLPNIMRFNLNRNNSLLAVSSANDQYNHYCKEMDMKETMISDFASTALPENESRDINENTSNIRDSDREIIYDINLTKKYNKISDISLSQNLRYDQSSNEMEQDYPELQLNLQRERTTINRTSPICNKKKCLDNCDKSGLVNSKLAENTDENIISMIKTDNLIVFDDPVTNEKELINHTEIFYLNNKPHNYAESGSNHDLSPETTVKRSLESGKMDLNTQNGDRCHIKFSEMDSGNIVEKTAEDDDTDSGVYSPSSADEPTSTDDDEAEYAFNICLGMCASEVNQLDSIQSELLFSLTDESEDSVESQTNTPMSGRLSRQHVPSSMALKTKDITTLDEIDLAGKEDSGIYSTDGCISGVSREKFKRKNSCKNIFPSLNNDQIIPAESYENSDPANRLPENLKQAVKNALKIEKRLNKGKLKSAFKEHEISYETLYDDILLGDSDDSDDYCEKDTRVDKSYEIENCDSSNIVESQSGKKILSNNVKCRENTSKTRSLTLNSNAIDNSISEEPNKCITANEPNKSCNKINTKTIISNSRIESCKKELSNFKQISSKSLVSIRCKDASCSFTSQNLSKESSGSKYKSPAEVLLQDYRQTQLKISLMLKDVKNMTQTTILARKEFNSFTNKMNSIDRDRDNLRFCINSINI